MTKLLFWGGICQNVTDEDKNNSELYNNGSLFIFIIMKKIQY